MGVTLHPCQLTHVRVEDFHPYFGAIGMGCISADRLYIHAGDGRGRINYLNRGIPGKGVFITKGQIVPEWNDRGGTLSNSTYLCDYRDKVASFIQFIEEIEAWLGL